MTLETSIFQQLDATLRGASQKKLAIAVSGGVDSLCLTYLTYKWAQIHNWQVVALTIDHGLRPESAQEAQQVKQWMSDHGIQHQILSWKPPSNLKGLQNQARHARYELLNQWCRLNEIPYLLLAHTSDDQYETIIMRLAHQSGPAGLAGIPVIRQLDELTLIRPLLGTSKEQIRQQMVSWNLNWIEDPSNQKDIFTRVKIRKNKVNLELEGLSVEKVLQLQKKMGLRRQKIEEEALKWGKTHVQFLTEGYAQFYTKPYLQLDVEFQEIILSSLLKLISAQDYAPGYEVLSMALEKIRNNSFIALTCHGCLIEKHKEALIICREEARIEQQAVVCHNKSMIWDQRYYIELEGHPTDLEIKPLGDAWLALKEETRIMALPLPIRRIIPSIWEKEYLIIVPHLDYYINKGKRLQCNLKFLPILDLCRSRFIID